MNIGEVLKKAGAAVLKEVVPGGGLILELINQFLPDEKKLPATATGAEAQAAIQALPPEQQTQILMKEMDVAMAEINTWPQVIASLASADASGASTRPFIALLMAWAVSGTVAVFVVAWAAAIATDQTATLKALAESWPMMLAVLGTPTALLRAYFGLRSDEKKARYSTATGGQVLQGGPLLNLIKTLTGR